MFRHIGGAKLAQTGAAVDSLVGRRLDPVRIRADLATTLDGIAALPRLGATVFAIVALGFGSWPNAVAIVDGEAPARRFVERFNAEGIPSLWPAGAVVGLKVFGVRPEDVTALADVARGRWHLPASDGSDRLIDPTRRPVAAPTRTAKRR